MSKYQVITIQEGLIIHIVSKEDRLTNALVNLSSLLTSVHSALLH